MRTHSLVRAERRAIVYNMLQRLLMRVCVLLVVLQPVLLLSGIHTYAEAERRRFRNH